MYALKIKRREGALSVDFQSFNQLIFKLIKKLKKFWSIKALINFYCQKFYLVINIKMGLCSLYIS